MKIKYFAWIRNITKIESEEILDHKIKDIDNLQKFLCKKYPKLQEYIEKESQIRIAVNLEYVSENINITDQDEIALFPPVSGG